MGGDPGQVGGVLDSVLVHVLTSREDILAEAGYEQVYDIDEIITRMPAPDKVTRLGIAAGTPVAEHVETGYTVQNKPVRLMISIVPGDTLILQYTIPT